MYDEKFLDISWGAILKISITFLLFYFLYLIRDILIWILFALIISVLFDPAIDFLQRLRVPRTIAVITIYFIAFGFLALVIYFTTPIFISEIKQFSQFFPQYFEKIAPPFRGLGIEAFENIESFISSFEQWLVKASSNIISGVSAIFGGIFSAFTIFTIAIFLSLEEKGVEKAIILLSPKKYEDYFLDLWKKCQKKISAWFGSRILSCLFVGASSYLTLVLFDINYAFVLSLFAGVLDIVPMIGPILAGIIITVITGLDSWTKALFVLIIFILIQQIEGNILVPVLTKKFVGIPSSLVLVSLIIGGKLLGILGAILSIPLTGILFEFSKDFLKKRKELSSSGTEEDARKKIIW